MMVGVSVRWRATQYLQETQATLWTSRDHLSSEEEEAKIQKRSALWWGEEEEQVETGPIAEQEKAAEDIPAEAAEAPEEVKEVIEEEASEEAQENWVFHQ